MGVFRKDLLGVSAEEEIQAVFGHWVNKVLAFSGAIRKENWSENYEQYKRNKRKN
jgi:hypothetical protein